MGISGSNYIKEGDIPGHVKQTNLEAIKILAKQMEESVCKIYGSKLNGTGFFCAIQNMKEWNPQSLYVLMTNNHVLGEKDIKPHKKIKISLNNENKKLEITIDYSRKKFTSQKYDVTIVEIRQNDGIESNSFMQIDQDIYKDDFIEIFKKKSIYLLHYPKGKEICKSEEIIRNIGVDNYTIEHFCDSTNGSSGGPLINLKNNKVLGIHKGFNGDINLGTILREPIEKFYEIINNNIHINNNNMSKDKGQKLNKNNNNASEKINNNKELNEIDEINIQYKINNVEKIQLFGYKFVKK